jgi:hypothetical protein
LQSGHQLTLSITGQDGVSSITTRSEVFVVLEDGIHDDYVPGTGTTGTRPLVPPILNPREPPRGGDDKIPTNKKPFKAKENDKPVEDEMTPEEITAAK